MNLGTTAIYDLQERRASSKSDAIRKLIGENERQSTPRFDVHDFLFTGTGPHRGFTQDWLEDLWSAQVVASWITDWGIWKKTFPEQEGMVRAQGFMPADITPLSPQSNGRVTLDLSTVLQPVYTIGDGIIQGPDGIYGPSTDSLFAEYARTGKIFGALIPSIAKPVFDRILASISTRDVSEARAEAARGQTASRESADAMGSSSVSGDAQINAGMEQTKPSNSLGQTWASTIIPNLGLKTLNPVLIANIRNLRVPAVAVNLTAPPPGLTPPKPKPKPATTESKAEAASSPFYKSPWFYVGVPLVLIGAGVGIYAYTKNKGSQS